MMGKVKDAVNAWPPAGPSSPTISSPLSLPSSPEVNGNLLLATNRSEKLEKYRQKRMKRNWNRGSDPIRRERAQSRLRDTTGQFIAESLPVLVELDNVKNRLAQSETESQHLHNQLSAVMQELGFLRKKAEDALASKESMQKQLEEQTKINDQLINENQILWSTVPANEVFSTIRPGNPLADPFKENIKFSDVELNCTGSPFLQAARIEDEEFELRWEGLNFTAGSFS